MRKILVLGSIGTVVLLILVTLNPIINVQATHSAVLSKVKTNITKNISTLKNYTTMKYNINKIFHSLNSTNDNNEPWGLRIFFAIFFAIAILAYLPFAIVVDILRYNPENFLDFGFILFNMLISFLLLLTETFLV